MRLLLLDAALDRCLAALWEDGVLALAEAAGAHGQAAALPPLAAQVLQGTIAAVVVCVGPGSFTGIRTALALAEGVALAQGVPVLPVTVGEALAMQCGEGPPVWSLTENRRGDLFWEGAGPPCVVRAEALPLPPGPIRLAGDGAGQAAVALRRQGALVTLTAERRPEPAGLAAAGLARRTKQLPPLAAAPLYIDPPATT